VFLHGHVYSSYHFELMGSYIAHLRLCCLLMIGPGDNLARADHSELNQECKSIIAIPVEQTAAVP
jgi:hypothetical protein